MMSVEGSFLAALIARLPEPKFNLAAYGVAFSFALIIEAPIIMIMSASTALVKNYLAYKKLKVFTYGLNLIITLLMLVLIIPFIFYFITEDLIGLPPKVSHLTHIATILLLPWPGAIGYRRFYQGILIRNNLTRRVAYGTIIRILTMSVTAFSLFFFTRFDGVIVGAASLSVAVIVEAIASKVMAVKTILKIKEEKPASSKITYKEIYKFYYPLALTSLIGLGVQPLVTFFVGQSKLAIESLAVLPVVTSFVFIFRALGLSYQEAAIALLDEKKTTFTPLRNFALLLGSVLTVILVIISFTPLADIWFKIVSGLSDSLAEFARLPLMIMSLFPFLTVLISFQRGLLVNANNTKPITFGTATEFIVIIIVMFVSVTQLNIVGAVAAAISFVTGRITANIYLTPASIKAAKN